MPEQDHYDIVIIGSGAGGGTLAWKLAPSGKSVLLLERGDYLLGSATTGKSTAVFVRGKYQGADEWVDKDGNEFPPEVNYYVGGNTKFYGAALFRLRPEDFGVIHHHGGLSPAWPISYYDTSSRTTPRPSSSTGCMGGTARTRPRGHASADYPYPPVEHEPRIQELHDDLEEPGPAPVPPADRGEPAPGRARGGDPLHVRIRCNRVDGFPCLVDAKADAQVVCVDPPFGPPQRDAGDRCACEEPRNRRRRPGK